MKNILLNESEHHEKYIICKDVYHLTARIVIPFTLVYICYLITLCDCVY